jgi:hypothetical protein
MGWLDKIQFMAQRYAISCATKNAGLPGQIKVEKKGGRVSGF